MCDGLAPRIATYVFMTAGLLAPLTAIAGAKIWPDRAKQAAVASLFVFVVAAVAGAFVLVC